MYLDDPIYPKPDDKDTKIWRYLDIPKFISLIDNRALFFSRADHLGDPFEGSIPQTTDQINLNHDKNSGKPGSIVYSDDGTPHEAYSMHDFFRKTGYVCGFHVNPYESAAFWSIYTKSKQGVAIQSTFNRLCNCFHVDREENEKISLVTYIDYTTDTIPVSKNAYLALIHKRKSFEHEKELRAIITFPHQIFPSGGELPKELLDNFPKGILIPVDLDILIEKIYIAPTSPQWMKELLTSISRKYELRKEILQSTLDLSPII
jgi:hypothetical protein